MWEDRGETVGWGTLSYRHLINLIEFILSYKVTVLVFEHVVFFVIGNLEDVKHGGLLRQQRTRCAESMYVQPDRLPRVSPGCENLIEQALISLT